jgi:hypothetical protein
MKTILVVALLAFASPASAAGPWVDKGFWRMNETTGNVVRDRIAKLNGQASNAAIVLKCRAGAPCRNFNGVNSHILVPYSAAVSDPGFNNLSYSAFIKPSLPLPPNGDDIIHVSGYPKPHYKLEISEADSPRQAKCGVRGSANKTVAVAGGPNLYDGKWHKVECRVIHKPSDHLELWVDGAKVASVNGPIGSIVTETPILLGKHSTVEAGRYKGQMDDVRIRWQTP